MPKFDVSGMALLAARKEYNHRVSNPKTMVTQDMLEASIRAAIAAEIESGRLYVWREGLPKNSQIFHSVDSASRAKKLLSVFNDAAIMQALISGCIRSTMDAHGGDVLSKEFCGSAAKRVYRQLLAAVKAQALIDE